MAGQGVEPSFVPKLRNHTLHSFRSDSPTFSIHQNNNTLSRSRLCMRSSGPNNRNPGPGVASPVLHSAGGGLRHAVRQTCAYRGQSAASQAADTGVFTY